MIPKKSPQSNRVSYPEAKLFYSKKASTGSRFSLASLEQKIKFKKIQGLKLSATDAYLLRQASRIQKKLFAPSRISVITQIAKACLQPMPIVLVLSLIFASEVNSRAWFQNNTNTQSRLLIDTRGNTAAAEALAEEEDSLIERVIEESSLALNFKRKYRQPAYRSKQGGLIQFISGLIAVYCPSVRDPGLIAQNIVKTSQEEQVDPLYVAAVIATESGFRTKARSRQGAMGLMQLLPGTAREVSRRHLKKSSPKLTDPGQNIKLGIAYLKQLEAQFRGNRTLALAAYNWGPSNVNKAGRSVRRLPKSVQLYSTSILEKTLRWNRHFKNAADSADALHKSMSS